MPKLDNVYPTSTASSYAVYGNKHAQVVLHALDDPFSLDMLDFTADRCFIFAETVSISTDLKISSPKQLTICCSNIKVVGDKQIAVYLVGDGGKTADTGGARGDDGGAGGCLSLYVENNVLSLSGKLRFVTDGGSGGSGGDIYEGYHNTGMGGNPWWNFGGQGGKGGPAGPLRLHFGSKIQSLYDNLMYTMSNSARLPWVNLLTNVEAHIHSVQDQLQADDPRKQVVVSCTGTFTTYQNIAKSCKVAAAASVKVIKFDALSNLLIEAPGTETVATASAFNARIISLLNASTAPFSVSNVVVESIDNVSKRFKAWMDKGGSPNEKAMEAAFKTATENVASMLQRTTEQNLGDVIMVLLNVLSNMQQEESKKVASLCSAHGGAGGLTGTNKLVAADMGARYKNSQSANGQDYNVDVRGLSYNEVIGRQGCSFAYAFPEQCQMLLMRADQIFYASGGDSVKVLPAVIMYTTLAQRLSFVPLLSNENDKLPQTTATNRPALSPLMTAFKQLELEFELTTNAIATLQNVYETAKAHLNRAKTGTDIFGNAAGWAPRLTPHHYKARADALCDHLKIAEDGLKAYEASRKDGDEIKAAIKASEKTIEDCEKQIDLLTKKGGTLQDLDSQIVSLTPTLEQAKTEVDAALKSVVNDIKFKVNLSMKTVLEGLASLAMAPTKFNAAVVGVNAVYNAFTQVDDSQGNHVNRKLVVKKFESCEGNLASLSTAYSRGEDGSFSVADPAGVKVIAAQSDVTKMLDEFAEAIPESHRNNLKQQLSYFVESAMKRNSLVVSYNAALELYNKALLNKKATIQRKSTEGQDALKVDPALPAIFFWYNRILDYLVNSIMRYQHFEARALCYWGLRDPTTIPAIDMAPARTAAAFALAKDKLEEVFNEVLVEWANAPWVTLPKDGNALGILVELSEKNVASLKEPILGKDGSVEYTTKLEIKPTQDEFVGKANVRLNEVRVWLPGISKTADGANRQEVTIELRHTGLETILDRDKKLFQFVHDSVDLQFVYDAAKVNALTDVQPRPDKNPFFSTQSITKDYSGGELTGEVSAPVGPFTIWTIVIRESENKGLKMDHVERVFLDFCGREQPSR